MSGTSEYREYRDSGSKWLPRLPSHWEARRLMHVASAWTSNVDKHSVDGQTPVRLCNYTDVYKNHAIRRDMEFMAATATQDQIQRFRLAVGDTVITKDSETSDDIGIPAFVKYAPEDLICGYHLAIVRPITKACEPRYLFWSLSSTPTLEQWATLATGVTRVGIRSSDLAKATLCIPPLPEQRTIADYLDRETAKIDALIEKQELLIATLKERHAASLDLLVLPFASSSSRSGSGQWDGHRAVGPAIERLPEGWKVFRFKAVLRRRDERNLSASLTMLSLKSSGDIVPRSSLGERQEPDPVNIPRYLLTRPNDLVVNPMWLVGGAVGVSRSEGAVSPDYRVFELRGMHDPRFLHHLLRSRPYRDQYVLYTRANTTFDRRVQQPDLDNLPIVVPPLTDQMSIAKHIDEQQTKIDILISKAERFIELAKERRSALITAAVTGQIDVRDASNPKEQQAEHPHEMESV